MMGNSISTLGWILIIFLIVFIVSINIGLFMGIKKNNNGQNNWARRLQETGRTLKDPFQNENIQLRELAAKVEQLKVTKIKPVEASTDKPKAGEYQE